jgi:CBS domain-containing protein
VVWLSRDESKGKEREIGLRVGDVMVKEVLTIDDNVTVKKAVDVMDKFDIGCLIAIRKGKAIGILTERDILKRVVAAGKNAVGVSVREVMTSPLVVAEPDMDLEDAVKLMFQMKIKKLPVVDGKKIVGLVSLTDIARFQPQVISILKQLARKQAAPKGIKKIIDRYVV